MIDLKYNLPKIAFLKKETKEKKNVLCKRKKDYTCFVLCFATSIIASTFRENPGWFRNSAGFWFNSHFGFGLMNAYSLVSASYNWTTVPAKAICKVNVAKGQVTIFT